MGPPQVLYRALCRIGDKVVYPILPSFAKAAWNHPAGPKTAERIKAKTDSHSMKIPSNFISRKYSA
ncbi:hypothetical protein OESDEN_11463 [Oesophagostomum dentatum]|uniref:Uncharacterized protein n=1 Tax=Oesophagostomum dentatum TaxID=61180 RepID=A0A0B1T009_OESDE|nr:hypothetical protein OESDEN_11463 [Oesophagostomum dentatum]